jgi:hypothetical protein
MALLARLTFALLVAVGIFAGYTQVSEHMPLRASACLGGEQFTLHSAWKGFERGPDGGVQLAWRRWGTPDGEPCGNRRDRAVRIVNPNRTA